MSASQVQRGGPGAQGGASRAVTKADGDDPLRKAADWLRGRAGLEVRSSVLQDVRVDVFRSKDFLRVLADKSHPVLAPFLSGGGAASGLKLGALLLQSGYIFRVDRVVKERSKGRKHVKFPKSVEPHPQQEFAVDSFYVWRIEAPTTLWSRLGPLLFLVGVMAVTLFPVAPYKVKVGVVYTAMGLLALLFALTVLRLVLFVFIWIPTGRSVWLLPNLYAEDIPITHIFTPLIQETPKAKPAAAKKLEAAAPPGGAAGAPPPTEEEEEGPSLVSRLQVALAVCLASYAAYCALPEGTGVVSTAVGTSNSILEMLNLHDAGAKRLGNGSSSGGSGLTAWGDNQPVNASDLSNLKPTLAPQAPPMTAAEAAAAAALKGGRVGPAGVKPADAALTAEQLSRLAPIPEDEDVEGEEAAAAQGDAAAEAVKGEEAAPAQGEGAGDASGGGDEASPGDAQAEAEAASRAEL